MCIRDRGGYTHKTNHRQIHTEPEDAHHFPNSTELSARTECHVSMVQTAPSHHPTAPPVGPVRSGDDATFDTARKEAHNIYGPPHPKEMDREMHQKYLKISQNVTYMSPTKHVPNQFSVASSPFTQTTRLAFFPPARSAKPREAGWAVLHLHIFRTCAKRGVSARRGWGRWSLRRINGGLRHLLAGQGT